MACKYIFNGIIYKDKQTFVEEFVKPNFINQPKTLRLQELQQPDFLKFIRKDKQYLKSQGLTDQEVDFLNLFFAGEEKWIGFFIKSVIQDAAKKGYEKVLFPTGNTASKVEGHTTLEEFKKQKEDRIKELENKIQNLKNSKQFQKLTAEEKAKTIEQVTKEHRSITALKDLSAKLAHRIGGKVEFQNRTDVDWKGYNQGMKSVLNEAYMTPDTPFHEILAHPIIRAIKESYYIPNYVESEIEITKKLLNKEITREQAKALKESRKIKTGNNQLYQSLLKELETGRGKEVFEQVKRDYPISKITYDLVITKDGVSTTLDTFNTEEEAKENNAKNNYQYRVVKRTPPQGVFTEENQQEEAIVTLLGMMAADKLDVKKDATLISKLKELWKQISDFVKSLLRQDGIKIDELPITTTLNDLAEIMAYGNNKIILPGYKVEYSTPLGNKYDTLEEVNQEIKMLSSLGTGEKIDNITPEWLNKKLRRLEEVENRYKEEGIMKNSPLYNELEKEIAPIRFIKDFIEKNKEYEQSKEIIEQWKKENNIKYDPEEVYSRGQGFYSSIGAYSNLELDLLLKNLIQHIEDNKKAGGEFTISAFTRPINKRLKHIEGTGDRIRFVIYPRSEDIKWAAPTDVYSGSVWDAHEKVSKDKKSELLGVSFTKAPALRNINEVSPNLADIIDNLSHVHNELGIELTTDNFRIEYDDSVDYSTKKLIDNINKILDDKYGKLVKPEINTKSSIIKATTQEEVDNLKKEGYIEKGFDHEYGEQTMLLKGKQPTQTRENTTSIESVKNKIANDLGNGNFKVIKDQGFWRIVQILDNGSEVGISKEEDYYEPFIFDTKEQAENYINKGKGKEYTSQALTNLKVAAFKEVARKYPRSLITSKVVPINPNMVNNSEIKYSKVENIQDLQNEINQLKQELERVEKEGFAALRPIYNFYENTVTNILKKQGYNPVLITDEYGNTWNEIIPKQEKILLASKIEAIGDITKKYNSKDLKEQYKIPDSLEEYINSNNELANFFTKALRYNTTVKLEFTEGSNAFIPATNSIQISLPETAALSELSGLPFSKVLNIIIKHELAHSMTLYAIENDKESKKTLENLLESFKKSDTFNKFQDEFRANSREDGKTYQYDLDEFVADIFSNPFFIKYTQGVNREGTKVSWYKSILNTLKRFFNKYITYTFDIDTLYDSVLKTVNTDVFKDTNEYASDVNNTEGMKLAYKAVNTPNEKFSNLRKQLHDSVVKMEAIYKNKSGSKQIYEDVIKLKKTLDEQDDVTGFMLFIDNAKTYLELANTELQKYKKQIQDFGVQNLAIEAKQDMMWNLQNITNFLGIYNILNELETLNRSLGGDTKLSNSDVQEAINYRKDIISAYTDVIYPLLSDYIFNSRVEKFELSREEIEQQLIQGGVDIGLGNLQLGATINSQNPINGLVASKFKEILEESRQKDLSTKNNLLYLYNQQSGPKDIPSEFNKQFLRDAKVVIKSLDAEGKEIEKVITKKAFIQEYDTDEFYYNKKKFFEELGPEPTDEKELKKRRIKIAKWFTENQSVRNPQELIALKKQQMTTSEFSRWFKDNVKQKDNSYNTYYQEYNYNVKFQDNPEQVVTPELVKEFNLGSKYLPVENKTYYILSGEFVSPSEKYRNSKYDLVKNNPYYTELLKVYNTRNNVLPLEKRLKHGIIPQDYKGGFDKAYEAGLDPKEQANNVLQHLKSKWGIRETDNQLGLTNLQGDEHKYIPLYYTTFIEEDQVSLDLLQSVLQFSQMSNTWETLNKAEPYMRAILDIAQGNTTLEIKQRSMTKGTNGLKELYDRNIPKKANRANEQLIAFINAELFGEREFSANIGNISLNKAADRLIYYTSLLTLSGNFIGMFNNTLIGNYNTLQEAVAGKYFNLKHWFAAQKDYHANLPSFLADLTRVSGKSLESQLIEYFDAFQGEFSTQYGTKVSGSRAGQLFTSDLIFFTTNAAEHQIQTQGLFALLRSNKVKKKDGTEIMLKDAFELDSRQVLKLKDDVIFTKEDKFKFVKTLHSMNKKLNGNYNTFDRSLLQRMWYGKLVMLFRKHIWEGFKRRWGSAQLDIESEEITRGYYLDAGNAFRKYFKALFTDFRNYGYQNMFKRPNLSKTELEGFRRTVLDIGTLSLLALIFTGLHAAADDEDDEFTKAMYTHGMLQSRRLMGDIWFYANPVDFLRLMKNPSVTQTTIGKILDVGYQLTDPTETYANNTKMHDKGDNKLAFQLTKLVPWYSQYRNLVIPENQLSVFNKSVTN